MQVRKPVSQKAPLENLKNTSEYRKIQKNAGKTQVTGKHQSIPGKTKRTRKNPEA